MNSTSKIIPAEASPAKVIANWYSYKGKDNECAAIAYSPDTILHGFTGALEVPTIELVWDFPRVAVGGKVSDYY